MKSRTKIGMVSGLALLVGLTVAACGDDDATPTTTSGPGGPGSGGSAQGGGGSGGGIPGIPTLGAQVDRKGRPGINTVGNTTFVLPPGAGGAGGDMNQGVVADDRQRGANEGVYNADDDPGNWLIYFDIAKWNIAVYDALDAGLGVPVSGCGNQLLYEFDPGSGATPDYTILATVLMHDWLLVKLNAADGCTEYLGAEIALVDSGAGDDCGGRRPIDDVIDRSYGLLVSAGLAISGYSDGVDAAAPSQYTDFPYLGPSHQK
jgi:hypothetical protein